MSNPVVALIQMRIGDEFHRNIKNAEMMIENASSKGAEIICLPEYFFADCFIGRKTEDVYEQTTDKVRELLETLSRDYNIIIAGTALEKAVDKKERYFNTCFVYENGKLILKQRKVHLTEGEERWGLSSGESFLVGRCRYGNIGVLVCADVLYPEAGRVLGLKRAEIVMNPVVSKFFENDLTKEARRSIHISRAYDNSFFIIKVSGVGRSPFGHDAVGRSFVASPWGIIKDAEDERKTEIILARLDMDLLREISKDNYSLTRRNKKAYVPLIE